MSGYGQPVMYELRKQLEQKTAELYAAQERIAELEKENRKLELAIASAEKKDSTKKPAPKKTEDKKESPKTD